MSHSKDLGHDIRRFGFGSLLICALLLAGATLAFPQNDGKTEVIDATARGTGTDMGRTISVKITISKYSTQEDRQAFIEAYKKGQNQGLVDALEKAPSVGTIALTGTVGNQLAYISLTKTATGRQIRFAANRWIRFGEVRNQTRSTAFNLTAGQIDLNDSDNKKSSGVLYPASQLIINKDGQLQFELRRNPWNLINIIDWNQAGAGK